MTRNTPKILLLGLTATLLTWGFYGSHGSASTPRPTVPRPAPNGPLPESETAIFAYG